MDATTKPKRPTQTSGKTQFEPAFRRIAAELVAEGRPLPPPLQAALDDNPQPLALDTRETWPIWAELNGYDDRQTRRLMNAIGSLVVSKHYLEALAADLAERVDVDGIPVADVSGEHGLAAALLLHGRVLAKSAGGFAPTRNGSGNVAKAAPKAKTAFLNAARAVQKGRKP